TRPQRTLTGRWVSLVHLSNNCISFSSVVKNIHFMITPRAAGINGIVSITEEMMVRRARFDIV
ncbi:MAG: hypothetical protein KGD60_15365, partial [Candidatus Thorarchaeota archaeon]|nr:hypothetical protein [Candidatus Thorarchaeota archaeon]